jgi:uncharacterized protein
LSDGELDQLSEVLQRFGGRRAMNLESLDGFLAALACGPVNVPQSEYLREVWGDKVVNESQFAAQPILREFGALVARHREVIAHTLRSGEVYTPMLLADEHGKFPANDWAIGFTRGLRLRSQEWAILFDDDDHGGSLVPIFALAHEHDPDPEMRPYSEPVSAEMREKLIVGAAAGVMKIFEYFEAQRVLRRIGEDVTYRRMAPKVGRDDPCPCGSGKQFKQCCGKITLH